MPDKKIENERTALPPLPKLPHGEGSMSYTSDGQIIYKKSVKIADKTIRISVRAKTPSEATRNMRKKERELRDNTITPDKQTLSQALSEWLTRYKQPSLKMKSYDRIETTFKNQVFKYPVACIRWNIITPSDIQSHLSTLVQQGLSWSTIKKAYDLLNEFFTYQYTHGYIPKNPMVEVKMPVKDNVLKKQKTIEYLKKDEIAVFCDEAYKLCDNVNLPKYAYGAHFVFIIYTGIRVGELLALRWKDIDFEKRTMLINKSIEEVVNREYDESNPELMKKKGITRKIQREGSTKNHQSRLIALNSKAMQALLTIQKYSQYTSPEDYVACTRHGTCNNEHNLYRRLSDLLKRCDIPLNQAGCHMLRHTCASLLFANGLQVEIIASILGHSPEVCRKTYIHFCQEQQAAAIHGIPEFNI